MAVELVYHRDVEGKRFSPFDERAVNIARDSLLRIACPYFTLPYLSRLIELSSGWQLLTDGKEWLQSLPATDRRAVADFIAGHTSKIRHFGGLHAKVLIGPNNALVGSANFTFSGIQSRTEMCVFFEHEPQIAELTAWFDAIWLQSAEIETDALNEFVDSMPEAPTDMLPIVGERDPFGSRRVRHAALIPLHDEMAVRVTPKDIRTYRQGARLAKGYYVGRKGFCVMKGSDVRAETTPGFSTYANGNYNAQRDELIRQGTLAIKPEGWEYEFTKDYEFSSSSAAASIVDGAPRSGPECWGSR